MERHTGTPPHTALNSATNVPHSSRHLGGAQQLVIALTLGEADRTTSSNNHQLCLQVEMAAMEASDCRAWIQLKGRA